MSNAEAVRTEPAKITKHRVEAVEYEVAVCPNCNQDYDPDEMVEVAVGIDTDDDGHTAGVMTSICPGCAGAVFNHDPADSPVEELFDELRERSRLSLTTRAILFAFASVLSLVLGWFVAEAMAGVFEAMLGDSFSTWAMLPVSFAWGAGPIIAAHGEGVEDGE